MAKSNIIEQIEAPYRNSKQFGVQFHLDPVAYECDLGDRVSFGENTTEMQCGTFYNYQSVLLDGEPTGAYLEERQRGGLFDPIIISYHFTIADWCDEKWLSEEVKQDPHFHDDGECFQMCFATLNQLIKYLNETGVIKL